MDTRKLTELDEKLTVVRAAKHELERLEKFLDAQKRAAMGEAAPGYLAQVRVSQDEINAQVKRANELSAKWNK